MNSGNTLGNMLGNIPEEVCNILETLSENKYQAYLVGGCVRDLILGRVPKDWDVTTNAKPDEIQKLFPDHVYENVFGTVAVKTGSDNLPLKIIEVTPYRLEGKYSDTRHPDEVVFVEKLDDDLARRDFTINSIAMGLNGDISDPFKGQTDIENQIIRTVGQPSDRFQEDALRMLRAIRLASELSFSLDNTVINAITECSNLINHISPERIRDELTKLIMSQKPEVGFNRLQQTGLLKLILPELEEGVDVGQNRHHVYTVFEHGVKSLQFAAEYNYSLDVRLAALLHDIGKPRTKAPKDGDYTFYGHEVVSMHMAKKALERLRFSSNVVEKVTTLIRCHMFYYDIGQVTEAGARRLLKRVGEENWEDLIKVRIAERKGSGVPKAEPYRLRHLQFLVEKASANQFPTTLQILAFHWAN